MLEAIVTGVALGGLITVVRSWRVAAVKSQSRERLAVILLHEEMTAAIVTLDLALRRDDATWLLSMSESATLAEVWREHGQTLAGLRPQQWAALDEAVSAMTPRPTLRAAGTDTEKQRRSLTESRGLLVEGARILQTVLDQLPTGKRVPEFGQLTSLSG